MNNTGSPFMGRSQWDERAPKEQTDHVNRKLETYLKIYTVVKIRTQIGTWHSVAQEIGDGILKPCTSLCLGLVARGQKRWQTQWRLPQGVIKETANKEISLFQLFTVWCVLYSSISPSVEKYGSKYRSRCYYLLHDSFKDWWWFWLLFFFRSEFTNTIQPSVASGFIWNRYTIETSGLKSFRPSMMGPSVPTNQR